MPGHPQNHPDADAGSRRAAPGLAVPLRMFGVGLCALVLVIAVAGLAGGLEELPEPELPAVEVEEVAEGEPWNVTVVGVVLDNDLGPTPLREDDHHWLVVVAEVEITAAHSFGILSRVLYLSQVDGMYREQQPLSGIPDSQPADEVWMVRDATRAEQLHPGLTERLIFLWERTADASPVTEVEVFIVGMTWRLSSLSGYHEWLDMEPRARVTVPVRDRRELE